MLRRAWCLVLAISFPLAGCSSTGDEAPKAVDLSMGGAPDDGTKPREFNPAAGWRPLSTWKDESEGPIATLVYITRTGSRRKSRPAAIIFSSDPGNTHFRRRKSTPQFTVRRLYKSEMKDFLRKLAPAGFKTLPWETQADYDAKIGSARGFHFYENAKRTYVLKDSLGLRAKLTFRKVEDKIIALTMSR